MALTPEIAKHVDDRRRIADALLTPEERLEARRRLGLSQEEVAEATGLSVKAIRLREQKDPQRRKVDIEAEIRYAELIQRAFGRRL